MYQQFVSHKRNISVSRDLPREEEILGKIISNAYLRNIDSRDYIDTCLCTHINTCIYK